MPAKENTENTEGNENTENTENTDAHTLASLLAGSDQFKILKRELQAAVKLSLTGLTNLVVNYENPTLVDDFLDTCFKPEDLYHDTINIDSIELQRGSPGKGFATKWLDELIYGTIQTQLDPDTDIEVPIIDSQTGKRQRNLDGFVNRRDVMVGNFKDKLLIIKNIDYCLDFCPPELGYSPGEVHPRALWVLDHFRTPKVKMVCRILLVTNEPLKLPFKIRTISFKTVDAHTANHIIEGFVDLYKRHKLEINFTDNQREQLIRKLSGLTYTVAGDALAEALSNSGSQSKSQVNTSLTITNLRKKINANFMEDAVGLTHLTPKPWEDYIRPEASNFTYDVKKILRDFDEIKKLRLEQESFVKSGKDDSILDHNIQAIYTRMPHVILLHGRGGVGKSAFPIHFAGLLDFDVWDFNVNAAHSKWVGEGSKQMRDALEMVKKASHLILRIDEYDRSIGSTQASGHGMHESHKQVESEFMNWLQNNQEENMFVKNNIFLVLTTNHKDNITGPLLRSGRVDLVIDIDQFDKESMKETFITAPRRMFNRGISVVGFANTDNFLKAVNLLDLDKLSEICVSKGFTVRDVDVLLIEMAAHAYYNKKYKNGIPWNTESFVKVLERSEGSAKDEMTNELSLGDRFYHELQEEENLPQYEVIEEIVEDLDGNKKKKVELKEITHTEKMKNLVENSFG